MHIDELHVVELKAFLLRFNCNCFVIAVVEVKMFIIFTTVFLVVGAATAGVVILAYLVLFIRLMKEKTDEKASLHKYSINATALLFIGCKKVDRYQ